MKEFTIQLIGSPAAINATRLIIEQFLQDMVTKQLYNPAEVLIREKQDH